MIRNTTLDFIDSLDQQNDVGGILEAMRAGLADFGIDLFCLNALPIPGRTFEEVLLASRVPADWMKLYIRKNYAAHDPSQRYAKYTVNPYEWKDAPHDPEREPNVLEFLQRANDFNIDHGFVVPIPSPHGCIGQVWMGGHNLRLTRRDKPSLHLMALYAFDRVRQLCGQIKVKHPLSERQKEILTWTAAGKTAWEIGEILHVSHRTVEWHLQSVAQKLGTLNKMQTIAVALREQLISI